jgi:Tfp pilus assembly protein PilF
LDDGIFQLNRSLHLESLHWKVQIRHMGNSRWVAVVGTIVMVFGAVSCSGSSPETAATSVLGSDCVGCPFGHGSLAQAKAEFEKEAKADPKNKYPWYNLGIIAQGSGDTKAAEVDFLKAISIDPKFESALYQEGLVRFHANDIPGAISYLTRAVTADEKDSCAHWVLGLALDRESPPTDNHRATNELRAALKIDPALIKGINSRKVKRNEVPGCD